MDAMTDEESTYKGRTVSQLATMFESKIREKVRASPYLRHYQKLSEPKVNSGEKCAETYTEKHPPPVIKAMTMPIKVQSRFVESCNSGGDGRDYAVFENNSESESRSLSHSTNNENCIGEFASTQAKNDRLLAAGESTADKKATQEDFGRCRSSTNMGTPEFIPKVVARHKRSKSLTSSFHRLLRREKRVDSMDGSGDRGRRATLEDTRNIEPASDTNSGYISTPKMSLSTRRRSADDGHKKQTRRKSGRLRGFFRAISLNSIADNKRNSMFASDGLLCSKCKGNEVFPKKVFSTERFNSLKDERDMLKDERDRAVEEWSHAASRWEQMLDDMDAMMSELIQVRSERDDKAADIREMINDYEDELKVRGANYENLEADFADLEDQLQVAKKERIDALAGYDELLKRNYDISVELEKAEDMNLELQSCVSVNEQDIACLNQQVDNLHEERNQALELWNASVEERKKLHQEMESLILSRDHLLRRTFQQTEEINSLRKDRDALQRIVENRRENGYAEAKDFTRETHKNSNLQDNNYTPLNGYETDAHHFDHDHHCVDNEEEIPEFIELAVSLERLDSKYGIRVDAAVDEPKIMIVHVGAHATSLSNIRKYDRILSINGMSVVRSDKKAVEKIIRDCPGRLTMVLRRENPAFRVERVEDVDLLLPKISNRNNRNLGLKCKIQVVAIEEDSLIGENNKIEVGDLITKINTQDISKVFEAVLYKISKKQGGKLSMRLQKKEDSVKCNMQELHLLPEHLNFHQKVARSASNISQSSNQSMPSNNSEHTYRTVYTDDNESVFSGSLAPSIIVHPCNEDDDGEVLSLSETLHKPSNQLQEIDCIDEGESVVESYQYSTVSSFGRSSKQANPRMGRKHSDVRSLRSLKMASSSRASKPPLRRVRSDITENAANAQKSVTPEHARKSGRVLLPVEELDGDEIRRNSWVLPSPEHTPIEDRRSKNSVSVFATLPRQKKKSVNEADCNKRTTHRVLRLEKAGKDPFGFDVCGGNKVGIFVKEVKDGSMAALGGMKVGDRILYINSYDLHCATLDYATRIILKNEKLTSFRIEVKYEEKFKDLLKEPPLDSLYVRTLRHFYPEKDGFLQFGVGEILLVTNTLVNYSRSSRISWQWYAQKVSRNSKGEQGLIPRLESFSEIDEGEESKTVDEGDNVAKKSLTSNERKKTKRSASEVKKWLLRKPSLNRRKKNKDIKETEKVDTSPFYEILWDK